MKKLILTLAFIHYSCILTAQIGIGTTTPDTSAMLDVSSTSKGMLLPRVGVFPSSPAIGLIVYRTDLNGFYAWDGAAWTQAVFGPNGTVTSVGATGSNGITVTGSPITGSGVLAIGLSNVPNASLQNSSISITTGTSGANVNITGSPVALGGTLTLNIPDASASARGVITTGAQVMAGVKTLSSAPILSSVASNSILYVNGTNTVSPVTIGAGLNFSSGTLAATGGPGSGWSLFGNSATVPGTNFIGTTDNKDLVFKVNNVVSGYLGQSGASEVTTFGSGSSALYKGTAIGFNAITSGNEAVALGHNANAAHYRTIAIGKDARASATTSNNDALAIGYNANADSYQGIAIGANAATTTNNNSMAVGVSATASGYQSAAFGNSATATAQNSTAIGNGASASVANTLILGGSGGNSVRVGIGTSNPTSKIQAIGIPAYSSDAAAGAAGLTAGAFYQTNGSGTGVFVYTGVLMVKQ